MNVNLNANLEGNIIVEHLYTVEDYATFNINVKSGLFTGASHFCIPKSKILSVIEELNYMQKELEGGCKINDFDSDAFISIEMEKFGHACIYGQIGGSHEENYLKFKNVVDQTMLSILVQSLKESL